MARLMTMIVMAFVMTVFPVMAQAAQPEEVKKAEAYFANLKTAQARFVQTSADGRQQRGTFYLSRPGKLRFQYDAPNDDFVVADGIFIYFYDGQMKQQTNAPISQTLADFLLRKDLKLSGDLAVTKIMRSGELVQIFLAQTDSPESGTLILGFNENKSGELNLKKWRIVDAMGNITEIELFNVQSGVKFKNKTLFAYHDPEPKGYNK
ncbi:MAG TPA: outer membrane lipoprotein carrier protein LolA [Alphaproteobacteria bacterium]|jgi:outer membrane lipoprotein-sorting protein|nr:outer membrane lipoprotein carrier protein LolA [Alphaproteobacteria bacterium]